MEKNQITYVSKAVALSVPTVLSFDNCDTITNP